MGFIERQLEAQRSIYNVDPPSMEGHARGEYLWDQVAAAKEELTEIRRCFDAKIYTGLQVSGRTLKTRAEVLAELADLVCFMANIAALESITTHELEGAHMAKIEQNRIRHVR